MTCQGAKSYPQIRQDVICTPVRIKIRAGVFIWSPASPAHPRPRFEARYCAEVQFLGGSASLGKRMQCSLGRADLSDYVKAQMRYLFPDDWKLDELPAFANRALERLEYCFSRLRLKGFYDSEGPRFNHLHSDQYAIFLYYLANTAHREKLPVIRSRTRPTISTRH